MMTPYTQWLGFAGTLLVCVAYFPQIRHLPQQHCSAGISVKVWLLWLAADLLIAIHAPASRMPR